MPAKKSIISILFFLSILIAAPVNANELDQAKAQGQVCEQNDGFLRAKAGAPGNIKNLVQKINAKRKDAYAKIAKKNGIDAGQVGILTAEKLKPKC